jgi:hypothetical protein
MEIGCNLSHSHHPINFKFFLLMKILRRRKKSGNILTKDVILNLALAFGFGFGFDKVLEAWKKAPAPGG